MLDIVGDLLATRTLDAATSLLAVDLVKSVCNDPAALDSSLALGALDLLKDSSAALNSVGALSENAGNSIVSAVSNILTGYFNPRRPTRPLSQRLATRSGTCSPPQRLASPRD